MTAYQYLRQLQKRDFSGDCKLSADPEVSEQLKPFLENLPKYVSKSLIHIPIGILPATDLNSWAFPSPNEKPIIAIHSRAAQISGKLPLQASQIIESWIEGMKR